MRSYATAMCLLLWSCGGDGIAPDVGKSSTDGPATGRGGANAVSTRNGESTAIGVGSLGPIIGANASTDKVDDSNICASASVTATRITPQVYFVIDGSSSMEDAFGDGTRWSVLRDALVGQNGVVRQLEGVVEFGMAIYSNGDSAKCPSMTQVPLALQNLSRMEGAYPVARTGGGTPTGEALQQVINDLPDFSKQVDSTERPPIIILATDGEPNGCMSAAACNWLDWVTCLTQTLSELAAAPATYDSTFAAVRAAQAKAVPVWVISLADGLASIPDLQKTANIGAGLVDDASPGATIYSPRNINDLTQTLGTLLGETVTCEVALAGTLAVNRACEGSVTMNGEKLVCNSDQGWRAVDSRHIVLSGAACDRFRSDPTVVLDAKFPCDVVVLL